MSVLRHAAPPRRLEREVYNGCSTLRRLSSCPPSWLRKMGGRIGRNQFVAFQDELRKKTIADQLVNLIVAEIASELIFVVVVAPDVQLFAVGCELPVFVQDYQLRRAPRLPGPANISPKMKFRFEVAAANKVITGWLSLDPLRRRAPRSLHLIGNSLATAKQKEAEKQEARSHQPVYSQPVSASNSLLHRNRMLVKLDHRIMIELEVYAAGVRDLNKILELDHQLEAVPGLRYKVDSNHDIVYLELDEPTITLREIRGTFSKLGLEPRFVGAIPPELRPRSKTQLLSA